MPNFLRLVIIGSLLLSVTAEATDPDFIINFDECKGVFAPLYLTKNAAIKIDDGKPYILACIRSGQIIDCQLDFKNGGTGIKGNMLKYKIVIDSPPLLSLELINGTENIMIDASQNAAVISTLVLDSKFAGSQICHGSYFTSFQLKN